MVLKPPIIKSGYRVPIFESKNVSNTDRDLYAVWGSSPTDVYTVGSTGIALHYNGTSWSVETLNTSASLHDVWGSSSSDVDVVGVGGRNSLIHYDGNSWSEVPIEDASGLSGVWGSSASDVYVVGGGTNGGAIFHFDGEAWKIKVDGLTRYGLGDIWGTSSDVFVVGDFGQIMHYPATLSAEMLGHSETQNADPTTNLQEETSRNSWPIVGVVAGIVVLIGVLVYITISRKLLSKRRM
jgi:hypothetical protein